MKKAILILLVMSLFGFLVFNANAAGVDKNKWKIYGVYQLNIDGKDFEQYLIFSPNNRFVFLDKYRGCLRVGDYFSHRGRDFSNANILFDGAEIGFEIKFINYLIPPRIELESKGQIFYFQKQGNMNIEDVLYKKIKKTD